MNHIKALGILLAVILAAALWIAPTLLLPTTWAIVWCLTPPITALLVGIYITILDAIE